MRSVAVLPLSAIQRMVTSRSAAATRGAGWCSASRRQSITTLHTMAPQGEPLPDAAVPAATFAQLLSRMRRETTSSCDAR